MSLSSIMSSGADIISPAKPPLLPSINSISQPLVPAPLFVKQEATTPAPADITSQELAYSRAYEAMPLVGTVAPPAQAVPHEIPVPDEALVEAELVRIETLEMGDLDDLGFEVEKEEYLQRSRKRALDIEASEAEKRKVRR
jgi:DNA helicase INO80